MRTRWIVDLKVKIKESEKGNRYLDLTREQKTMKHKSDGDTNCNRCVRNNPPSFGQGTRRLRNQKVSRDHRDYSIIKISQNIEKSWADLLSLKLQWKTIS